MVMENLGCASFHSCQRENGKFQVMVMVRDFMMVRYGRLDKLVDDGKMLHTVGQSHWQVDNSI